MAGLINTLQNTSPVKKPTYAGKLGPGSTESILSVTNQAISVHYITTLNWITCLNRDPLLSSLNP